jgi:hypothetical protein
MRGMLRMSRAISESSETVLQELVNAAVDLCGADSAGISLQVGEDETSHHRWVAAAGQYTPFVNATLPRFPSTLAISLESGKPQMFQIHKRFFDTLGVEAPPVTDGLLLPWQAGHLRGTIFVMAHGRDEAFDKDDCDLMEMLADVAAQSVLRQQDHKLQIELAGSVGALNLGHLLAHRINNPLQSLTNLVYLASLESTHPEVQALAEKLTPNLERLSLEVRHLLSTRIGDLAKA